MGPLLLKIGGAVVGLHFLSKVFGMDMDYNQALMMNYMRGHGHLKTYFADGLGSFMWGSRTASSMYGSFLFGGMGMYGGMHPYMHMMGMPHMHMAGLPYGAMGFGHGMWM